MSDPWRSARCRDQPGASPVRDPPTGLRGAAGRAAELGRPLVVIGDPDAGAHTRLVRAYGCGDLCIDLHVCPQCRVMQAADLTQGPVPGVADDSAVVYVSCVLEYVADPAAALRELIRMAGVPENLFLVFVDPWSMTATLYPGARWTGNADQQQVTMKAVTTARRVATFGTLAGLLGRFGFARHSRSFGFEIL